MAQSESNRFFEFGYSFDAAIFDAASPLLLRPGDDTILPALVYATSTNTLLGTIVNGEWVVRNRIHKEVENWQPKFKQAIQSLS
jgi:cytosine/adenosine deaminase-related metal-dependent hydrolase